MREGYFGNSRGMGGGGQAVGTGGGNRNSSVQNVGVVNTNIFKNFLPVKIRKRAGEIDIKDSDCDIKKFKLIDWAGIIFIILFLALIHIYYWYKAAYIEKVDAHFKTSIKQL